MPNSRLVNRLAACARLSLDCLLCAVLLAQCCSAGILPRQSAQNGAYDQIAHYRSPPVHRLRHQKHLMQRLMRSSSATIAPTTTTTTSASTTPAAALYTAASTTVRQNRIRNCWFSPVQCLLKTRKVG